MCVCVCKEDLASKTYKGCIAIKLNQRKMLLSTAAPTRSRSVCFSF